MAENVTAETFMDVFAHNGCEFVEGKVWKVSAIHLRHEMLRDYLRDLTRAYFSLTGSGRVLGEPFVMMLPAFPNRRREPDLLLLLNTSESRLEDTYLYGPADIVIEIVSPASVAIDYGEKFVEYEVGGVREYWIVDYERNNVAFFRLNDRGRYQRFDRDADGNYATPLLPGFRLHVPTLWQEPLPDVIAIVDQMRAALQGDEHS
ncbi:MAG: Uma2 family endonuclease [Candidatus Flexifilum sp.]